MDENFPASPPPPVSPPSRTASQQLSNAGFLGGVFGTSGVQEEEGAPREAAGSSRSSAAPGPVTETTETSGESGGSRQNLLSPRETVEEGEKDTLSPRDIAPPRPPPRAAGSPLQVASALDWHPWRRPAAWRATEGDTPSPLPSPASFGDLTAAGGAAGPPSTQLSAPWQSYYVKAGFGRGGRAFSDADLGQGASGSSARPVSASGVVGAFGVSGEPTPPLAQLLAAGDPYGVQGSGLTPDGWSTSPTPQIAGRRSSAPNAASRDYFPRRSSLDSGRADGHRRSLDRNVTWSQELTVFRISAADPPAAAVKITPISRRESLEREQRRSSVQRSGSRSSLSSGSRSGAAVEYDPGVVQRGIMTSTALVFALLSTRRGVLSTEKLTREYDKAAELFQARLRACCGCPAVVPNHPSRAASADRGRETAVVLRII